MTRKLSGLLVAVALAAATGCEDQPYDVIIEGGQVFDGTGEEAQTADVGLRGDRIADVGDLSGAPAERRVDASGLYVAPGFIDPHSHASGGLQDEDRSVAHALVAQGITTAFINPDGGGSVDIAGQRESLLEDGLGVNVAQFVPHGSVRREAMGGSHDRAPTDEELEEMRTLVRQGMEEGAFGLSTGLFYTPGAYAETGEVVELAQVVAEYDGVHSSHIRDESDYTVGVVNAVQEIIDISRESGVVGVVSHIKALGPNVWGETEEIVQRMEAAREDGVDVWADQYPYHASATGLTSALMPSWARDGGGSAMRERMDDPELADRIREDMRENLDRRGGADRIMFRSGEGREGRTLEEVAEEAGQGPVDKAFQLIRDGEAGGIISFNMNEEDIERLMRQPWTLTSTDGGLPTFGQGTPHPRTYGAFPRKIREYVVDRGVVDLPTAIRSMTGASAQVFRLEDRGAVRPGAYADLVAFDLERVNDPATFMEPHQYSEGMEYVLVNGEFVIDDGGFTNALPGRVLNLHGPDHGVEEAPVVEQNQEG